LTVAASRGLLNDERAFEHHQNAAVIDQGDDTAGRIPVI